MTFDLENSVLAKFIHDKSMQNENARLSFE